MLGESERLFSLTERLVRLPSVTGETDAVLRDVEAFFRAAGVPTETVRPPNTSPVLVAGRPPRPGLPNFLLATHLDTVKVAGVPSRVAGTVEEGRLYGRGATDMKGGVALAMLLLQEFHNDPRFNLGFVGTTDEEAESGGAWAVLDQVAKPDLVLVTEPTWEKVVLSASGRVVWQVRFVGSGGHGHHHKRLRASNALVALSELILATRKDYTALRVVTEGEGEVTLPHEVVVRLDRVLPLGRSIEQDRDALSKVVARVSRKYADLEGSLGFAPRGTPWLPQYATSSKDPWVLRFLASAARDGKRPEIVHKAAVGDYNVFGSKFPTLGLGPGGDGMHGDDEWLDLISLERCWRAYRRFFVSVGLAPPARASAPAPARSAKKASG